MTKTELKTLENKVKTELIKEGFDLINSNLLLVERTFSNVVKKLNLAIVNNRTFIVTIECCEDTTDWKITAPNELAAKMTASANYNRKRFNILRCVEYGC